MHAVAPQLAQLDNLYPSYPSSAGLARAAVTRFAAGAGFAGGRLDHVRLCVSEAVTNAVVHAYPHGKSGPIRVEAVATAEELQVRIADDGCGLRSSTPRPGLGLGMQVMTKLSNGFAVRECASGGVDVDLRFEL